MRILSVRFKNLNSLAGLWNIDFTNPAYVSDGIFAITGPTGAGKTTILDAICLALYGRTPRLNRVTKTTNELMSRFTGDCLAEVCFETQAGRFRCHWSQHRARNKAGGELQTPRHELSHADTGEIIESRLRDVGEKIESITGMDYERFTRSMLLAQGGFAAFLQAPSNERAPILEQITGTEIYSRISMKVHEQRNEEAKKLERLKEDAAVIRLLTEEKKLELLAGLEEKLAMQPRLTSRRDALSKAIAWLKGLSQLELELKRLKERNSEHEQRFELYKPDLQRLDKAQRFKEIEGEYIKITRQRDDQNRELEELANNRERLPVAGKTWAEMSGAWSSAREMLTAVKHKQKQQMLVIKAVRELDIHLTNKCQQIKAAENDIEESKKLFQAASDNVLDIKISLQESRVKLDEIQLYLDNNAVDSRLIEELAAIKQVFASLKGLNFQYMEASGKLEDRSKLIRESEAKVAEHDSAYNKILIQTRESTEMHQSIVQDIDAILKGRELNDWRHELDSLNDRQDILEQLLKSQERITETKNSLNEAIVQQSRLNADLTGINGEIQSCESQQLQLEKDVYHLEIQLDLLKRIQSLEEQRACLEDGQACPLCGSLHHPYVQGNTPKPNDTELSLNSAKKRLKNLSTRLAELKVIKAEINKDLVQLKNNEIAYKSILEVEGKSSADFIERLNLNVMDELLPDTIYKEEKDVEINISKCSQLIFAIEQKQREEKQALKRLEDLNKSLAAAEKNLNKCRHDLEMAQNEYDLMEKQCVSLGQQLAQARDQAVLSAGQYGVDDFSPANLDHSLDILTERRNKWQAKQAEKEAREKMINLSELELARKQTLGNKIDEELRTKNRDLGSLRNKFDKINLERQALFADKNPDNEEKRLNDEVQDAEYKLAQANDNLRNAELEMKSLKEKFEILTLSTQARNVDSAQMEQAFAAHLIRLGFTDEPEYRASRLDEQEFKKLIKTSDDLKKEKLEIFALIQDKSEALNVEQDKKITDQTQSELEISLSSCEADIANIQQEIGALKTRLNEDEQARQGQQEIMKNIEAQTRELQRWSNLHELIGSADGKKYRNFAQGLTFQTMVSYANQQLSKMTDRYLLATDNTEMLELNVIDNYQAGEIRSTKNLSGGESFIVSLALALGLSSMTSRNVRIDSFFLDEGFGSLDEYALDTALETLAGLHQEGKIIGVISHVPALKERISAQIQVIPQTGGRSIIIGPGCERVSPEV
ncbi:MAG: AAA family ATPase [Syntrophomonas sp.]